MMDCTDRHFRWFMRLITRRALLYTEMLPVPALIHGDTRRFLAFEPVEHPVSAQLGGDDPQQLAQCARMVEDFGYDEVNLNVGCPSDRVQAGRFGACLMAHPHRVAAAVAAMRAAVSIPVTVKHRIGIDDRDSYADMVEFVRIVADAGCDRFTVHARKAWLSGLSPRENRTVPPLRHADVHQLKREHPELVIETNGGVGSIDAVEEQLVHVDAVMVGRAAYEDPYRWIEADRRIFGVEGKGLSRAQIVERVAAHADAWVRDGGRLQAIARHLFGLFAGQPGARAFRRHLSTYAWRPGASSGVLLDALAAASRARERLAS